METINNNKILSERIYKFIAQYAAISPNWDGTNDTKFTCPDVYQMLDCADTLRKGDNPQRCFSEWGSGGYKLYSSKEGKEEHDELVTEIYKIINS